MFLFAKSVHVINAMKIIDVVKPERVKKPPEKSLSLFSSGEFKEQGFVIKKVELRLYVEKTDEKLGPFSLITTFVETDKGSIEMTYDEGYRGPNPLESTAEFLTSNLGISGLVLRSIISLKEEIKKHNS